MPRLATCCLRLGVVLCLALLSPVVQAQINVEIFPGSIQGAGFGQIAPSHNATIAIHSTNGPFYGMVSGAPGTMWTYSPGMGTISDVTISGVIREDEMGALNVTGMFMSGMMMSSFNVHVANVTFPCKTPTCDPMDPMSCMGTGTMCDPVIEGELSVAPGQTVGTSIRVCCGLPGTLTVTPASSEIELLDANGAPLGPQSVDAGVQSVSIQIRARTTFTGGDQLTARFVHAAGGSSAADVLNVVEGTPPPTVEIAQIIDTDSDPEGMEADDTPPLQKYVGNGVTLQAIPDPTGGTFSPAVTWTLTSKPMGSLLGDTMPLGTGDTVSFTPDMEGTYSITATSGSSSMPIDVVANLVGILKIVDTDTDPEGNAPDDMQPLLKTVGFAFQLQAIPEPQNMMFPAGQEPTWTVNKPNQSTPIPIGQGQFLNYIPDVDGMHEFNATCGLDIASLLVAVAPPKKEIVLSSVPQAEMTSYPFDTIRASAGQTLTLLYTITDKDTMKKEVNDVVVETIVTAAHHTVPAGSALSGVFKLKIQVVDGDAKLIDGNNLVSSVTLTKSHDAGNSGNYTFLVPIKLGSGNVRIILQPTDMSTYNGLQTAAGIDFTSPEYIIVPDVNGIRDVINNQELNIAIIPTNDFPTTQTLIHHTWVSTLTPPTLAENNVGTPRDSALQNWYVYGGAKDATNPKPNYAGVVVNEDFTPLSVDFHKSDIDPAIVQTYETRLNRVLSANEIINEYVIDSANGITTYHSSFVIGEIQYIDGSQMLDATRDDYQYISLCIHIASRVLINGNLDFELWTFQTYTCPPPQQIGAVRRIEAFRRDDMTGNIDNLQKVE